MNVSRYCFTGSTTPLFSRFSLGTTPLCAGRSVLSRLTLPGEREYVERTDLPRRGRLGSSPLAYLEDRRGRSLLRDLGYDIGQ
jgi:hypothetical protein